MRIAVIGGTGHAGRAAVQEAAGRGHDVVVVGRNEPEDPVPGTTFARADVTTGEGLDDALRGVDAVVDASNITSQNERTATDFFVGATEHLLAAETAAGVGRHVVLSIVGIDDVPTGYYRAKLAQERTARAGSVPVSVVRATQFHDFPAQVLSVTARGPLAVVPSIPVQPVSTREVAQALLDAAEAAEPVDLVQVGGPERRDLVDLARRTLEAQGRKVFVLRMRMPCEAGRAMRDGGLLLKEGRQGSERFEDWLATSR